MERPNYEFLWQCIGMIVGVYGIGYWVAADNVARHWPIVLVGLLGKILGPLGFIDAYFIRGTIDSPLFALTLLTNDLIWWLPFTLILVHAFRENERARHASLLDDAPAQPPSFDQVLRSVTLAPSGQTLLDASRAAPHMVVFLRHSGCTFCREALTDLARDQSRLNAQGVRLVLVHMGSPEQGETLVKSFGLDGAVPISDPQKRLYAAFNLARGSLTQLFGPRVWVRGFVAGILRRHGVGALVGDGFQMPGAFLVHQGVIRRAFRHADAADRPDYCTLAQLPATTS
jgi:peroxiredoxin